MKIDKWMIGLFILLAALFAFIGYWFAEKEFKKELKKEKSEWIQSERETIRQELILKAKRNYENHLRTHGIDSMDYDQRAEWLMSNSAYE